MVLETKYKLNDSVKYRRWNIERTGMITKVQAHAYIDAGIVIYKNTYHIRYGTNWLEIDLDLEESNIIELLAIVVDDNLKTIN